MTTTNEATETNPITPATAAKLQALILRNGNKSYANVRTLARALSGPLANIRADGLFEHLHVVAIEAGPSAGRVLAALVFEPGTPVPSEAIPFAFAGILIFQPRA